jgi:methyl-accepting chemotaxis protein
MALESASRSDLAWSGSVARAATLASLATLAQATGLIISQFMSTLCELEEQSQHYNNITQAVEELSTSVKQLSQLGVKSAKEADELRRLTMHVSSTLGHSSDEVLSTIRTANATFASLSASADNMHRHLAQIDSVSRDTSTLALNATIVSAKAGEKGQVFNVVASEIKKLSGETSHLTFEINETLNSLRNDLKRVHTALSNCEGSANSGLESMGSSTVELEQMLQNTATIAEQVKRVATVLEAQSLAVTSIARDVSAVQQQNTLLMNRIRKQVLTVTQDSVNRIKAEFQQHRQNDDSVPVILQQCKADHVLFKLEIVRILVSVADGMTEVPRLKSHTECNLGRWYFSVSDPNLKALPAYQQLDGPHEAFHEYGFEALRRVMDRDFKGAVEQLFMLDQTSERVLNLLEQIAGYIARTQKREELLVGCPL